MSILTSGRVEASQRVIQEIVLGHSYLCVRDMLGTFYGIKDLTTILDFFEAMHHFEFEL